MTIPNLAGSIIRENEELFMRSLYALQQKPTFNLLAFESEVDTIRKCVAEVHVMRVQTMSSIVSVRLVVYIVVKDGTGIIIFMQQLLYLNGHSSLCFSICGNSSLKRGSYRNTLWCGCIVFVCNYILILHLLTTMPCTLATIMLCDTWHHDDTFCMSSFLHERSLLFVINLYFLEVLFFRNLP